MWTPFVAVTFPCSIASAICFAWLIGIAKPSDEINSFEDAAVSIPTT